MDYGRWEVEGSRVRGWNVEMLECCANGIHSEEEVGKGYDIA